MPNPLFRIYLLPCGFTSLSPFTALAWHTIDKRMTRALRGPAADQQYAEADPMRFAPSSRRDAVASPLNRAVAPVQDTAVPAIDRRAGVATSKRRFGTFASLRHRDYRLLMIGVLFTSGGMWMEQVALNWIVYDITNSPLQLGILNGLRALPSLVTGLFGGVAADRMNRKKLMLSTQWILLALYLVLAALILTGMVEIWHLMLFTVLTGIVWTFNQPVRQAILPNLVPAEDRVNAIGLQSSAFNVTRILGPAAGGYLIHYVGPGMAILAEAIAYVAVIVTTMMMRVPANPPRRADSSGMWEDLSEGFRYIVRTPDVRALIVMAFLPFVVIMPYTTLLTIVAKDIFHMNAGGYGLLMTVSGVGALAATLSVASLGGWKGKGKLALWLSLVMGIMLIGFALAPVRPLSYVFLILVSGATMAYMALSNTLVNMIVPNELRGRVMSVYMLDRGLMPLGSLAAGLMAAAWGAPLALAAMGAAGVFVSGLFFLVFPNVRRLE